MIKWLLIVTIMGSTSTQEFDSYAECRTAAMANPFNSQCVELRK